MVEFICVDCGVRVCDVGRAQPPDDRRCGVCRWLEAIEEPTVRACMKKLLERMTFLDQEDDRPHDVPREETDDREQGR